MQKTLIQAPHRAESLFVKKRSDYIGIVTRLVYLRLLRFQTIAPAADA
jgi:hypothetical protein